MSTFPITPNGKKKLQEELKHLITVERPKISHAIAEAREHGDLSENAEYKAAREALSLLETKIGQLENMNANLEIIDPKNLSSSDSIKFGATVSLLDDDTDQLVSYTIVGEYEANSSKKLISVLCPLAKSLIGKKKGEMIEVNTPKGTRYYTVKNIEYKNFEV